MRKWLLKQLLNYFIQQGYFNRREEFFLMLWEHYKEQFTEDNYETIRSDIVEYVDNAYNKQITKLIPQGVLNE